MKSRMTRLDAIKEWGKANREGKPIPLEAQTVLMLTQNENAFDLPKTSPVKETQTHKEQKIKKVIKKKKTPSKSSGSYKADNDHINRNGAITSKEMEAYNAKRKALSSGAPRLPQPTKLSKKEKKLRRQQQLNLEHKNTSDQRLDDIGLMRDINGNVVVKPYKVHGSIKISSALEQKRSNASNRTKQALNLSFKPSGISSNFNKSAEELRALYAGKPYIKPDESESSPTINLKFNICNDCGEIFANEELLKRHREETKHDSKEHLETVVDSQSDDFFTLDFDDDLEQEPLGESFNDKWIRLFSEKGYSVSMVEAFKRDANKLHMSKREIHDFLSACKPIKQVVETSVSHVETTVTKAESISIIPPVEAIVELPVTSPITPHISETITHPVIVNNVRGEKIEINTIGRDSTDQAMFRKAVSANYSHRCSLTGDIVAIEAAHIQTHSNFYDNSVENGIMLAVGLHRLFDKGIMIIDPDTLTVHFTIDCFYKKHLEGEKVTEGRIKISREKLIAKNKSFSITVS